MATDNIFAGSITCTDLTATGAVSFTGAVTLTGPCTITGLRTIGNSAPAITAARVLTALDSGGIFTVAQPTNPALTYAITLPTPTGAGLRFVLQLGTASNVAVTVVATGCTFEGTLLQDTAVVPLAGGGTFTFVATTGVVGDNIEFISTSTTKYFARAVSSVAAGGGITIA
jgi:hypothetical protein